jgi:hypothetical protein
VNGITIPRNIGSARAESGHAAAAPPGGGNAANVGDPTGRNDDGFMDLPLPFSVTFFGTTYYSLFINNNGNVSFGAGISAFIPTGPTGATQPVISPYFGDVDTRNAASGVVHFQTNTANQLVVTWDQVGFQQPCRSVELVPTYPSRQQF